jgi:hypothetical protein
MNSLKACAIGSDLVSDILGSVTLYRGDDAFPFEHLVAVYFPMWMPLFMPLAIPLVSMVRDRCHRKQGGQ